jgi:hypothetical protein
VNTPRSTSQSVYLVVNTIFGYNSAGLAGPSGTSVVFALDLDQVSTIVPGGSATQQLTLSDLGTDCPQTEAASVLATMVAGGRCDPILAAPDPVKSWALPCNACGRFGLFDPPYAVPPLQGGLIAGTTTTTMAQPPPQATTSVAPPPPASSSPPPPPPSSTPPPSPSSSTPTPTTDPTTASAATKAPSTPLAPQTTPAVSTTSPEVVTTNPATRVTCGLACLLLSLFGFVSVSLL